MPDISIEITHRRLEQLKKLIKDATIQSECENLYKCGTVLFGLLSKAYRIRDKEHEFVWRGATVITEIHRAWKYMKNIFDLNAKLETLHEAAVELHIQILKEEERGRLLPTGLFHRDPSMEPIVGLEGDVMTVVKNVPILDLNTEQLLQMKDILEARAKEEENHEELMQILGAYKQRLDGEEQALEERKRKLDKEFEDRQKQLDEQFEEQRRDLDRRMAEKQKKLDEEAEKARLKKEMRRLQELKDKALAERLAKEEAENNELKELEETLRKLRLERKETEKRTKEDAERRKAEHAAFEEKYKRDRARTRAELLGGWEKASSQKEGRKHESVTVSSSVKVEEGAYKPRQPRRRRSKSVDAFEWEQVHPANGSRRRSRNPFADFNIDTSIHEAPEEYYIQPRQYRHSMSRQQFLPPDIHPLAHRSSHNSATTIITNSFNNETIVATGPRRGGRYYDY